MARQLAKRDNDQTELLKKLQGGPTGFENVTSDMLSMPFLKIAQAISPQVKRKDPAYIDGLEEGMFFNSVSGTVYGESIDLIILDWKKTWLEWGEGLGDYKGEHTQEQKRALLESGELKKDPHNGFEFLTEEGTRLQETVTAYVFLPDHPEDGLVLMSFRKGAIGVFNKIIQKAMHQKIDGRRAGLKELVWRIPETVMATNKEGQSWSAISANNITRIGSINEKKYGKSLTQIVESIEVISTIKNKDVDYSETSDKDDEIEDFG